MQGNNSGFKVDSSLPSVSGKMDSHFHRSFSCSLSLAPVRCTCPSPDPPCPHRPPAIMATQAHLLLIKIYVRCGDLTAPTRRSISHANLLSEKLTQIVLIDLICLLPGKYFPCYLLTIFGVLFILFSNYPNYVSHFIVTT